MLRYIEKPNKMTEQSEGRVHRCLYLTLIFLLSTHKGQYTKIIPPLPAITWSNMVRVLIIFSKRFPEDVGFKTMLSLLPDLSRVSTLPREIKKWKI